MKFQGKNDSKFPVSSSLKIRKENEKHKFLNLYLSSEMSRSYFKIMSNNKKKFE